jgi:hypothetical protein
LFSPRWSPDGRYILAMTADYQKLVLFDVANRKWTGLVTACFAYPDWSRDGSYVYFADPFTKDVPFFRVRVSDRKLERLVNLGDYGRLAQGRFGLVDRPGARRFSPGHPRRQHPENLRPRLADAVRWRRNAARADSARRRI